MKTINNINTKGFLTFTGLYNDEIITEPIGIKLSTIDNMYWNNGELVINNVKIDLSVFVNKYSAYLNEFKRDIILEIINKIRFEQDENCELYNIIKGVNRSYGLS